MFHPSHGFGGGFRPSSELIYGAAMKLELCACNKRQCKGKCRKVHKDPEKCPAWYTEDREWHKWLK